MEGEFALEVGSLVLRDGVLSSKAVEHCLNFYVCFLGSVDIGHCAEATNGVTGGFCVVTVTESTALDLANTF